MAGMLVNRMRGMHTLVALAMMAMTSVTGAAIASEAAAGERGSASAHPALRYLALGDSYTIGEGVSPSQRWTHQLAALLRNAGIPLADPETIATTGWTTDELDGAIDTHAPAADYAFVSLLIGVNNQYRGRDVAEYATQFDAMLRRAIGFAGGRASRVLVLSIPDWGDTPFGQASGRDLADVATQLDAYNAAARAACARHGVAFVDITTDSRTVYREAKPDETGMHVDDGLHPSAALYARWARLALPAARQVMHGWQHSDSQ